jgi:hypothetical protein
MSSPTSLEGQRATIFWALPAPSNVLSKGIEGIIVGAGLSSIFKPAPFVLEACTKKR